MMHDSQNFESPPKLYAFRFFNGEGNDVKSRMVDASEDWLAWGSGRIIWYVMPFQPL